MAFEAFLLPIRGVQLLLAIITLGLSAYLASRPYYFDDGFGDIYEGARGFSEGNFNVFASVWTILVLVYLLLVNFRPSLGHKWAVLALDALTMLFWFAGFIAIAAVESGILVLFGRNAYNAAIALAVFGAFEWLLFLATTVLDVLNRNHGVSSAPKTNAAPMQGV